jgi:DNA recombination protein RmuC
MAAALPLVAAFIGLIAGALIVWLITRPQVSAAAESAAAKAREAAQAEIAKLREDLARREAGEAAHIDRLRQHDEALDTLRGERDALDSQVDEERALHAQSREALGKAGAQRDALAQDTVRLRAELAEARTAAVQEQAALRQRAEQEQQARQQAEQLLAELRSKDAERDKAFAEQRRLLDEAQLKFKDAFAAVAQQQLDQSNKSFLELAKAELGRHQQEAKGELEQRKQQVEALVKPIHDTLGRFNTTVQEIEKQRAEAYGGISAELKGLREAQIQLRGKADELTDALRGQPTKWGRWGELQLHNVVEMAGMLAYCDFTEQTTVAGDDGARLRPDMVVRLPNGRSIAVDSKAPVELYIQAMELQNADERQAKLAAYAASVRRHMKDLTSKAYWDRIPGSPEFVVMFVPGESFFSAALEADPALIEAGAEQRVILATPTTLIALLRAVAYGWKQEQLAENARHISEAGTELVKRLRTFAEHLQKVGSGLSSAMGSYNEAVGSLERRVLPAARRMQELGATDGKALPEVPAVETLPRQLTSSELFGE